MYAIDGNVMLIISWTLTLPNPVAFKALLTELGEVNTYLYA